MQKYPHYKKLSVPSPKFIGYLSATSAFICENLRANHKTS